MKILLDKSRVNFKLAQDYKTIDNNVCASRLYFSTLQETDVLKHDYIKNEKNKFHPDIKLINKVDFLSSDSNLFAGFHDRKIRSLEVILRKELGFTNSYRYTEKMGKLKKLRGIADYENINVEKFNIEEAFVLHSEVNEIFEKFKHKKK